MPKKVEIRYEEKRIGVFVSGLSLKQVEECANALLEAIIIRRKIKQDEKSQKHANMDALKGGNLFSSQ